MRCYPALTVDDGDDNTATATETFEWTVPKGGVTDAPIGTVAEARRADVRNESFVLGRRALRTVMSRRMWERQQQRRQGRAVGQSYDLTPTGRKKAAP